MEPLLKQCRERLSQGELNEAAAHAATLLAQAKAAGNCETEVDALVLLVYATRRIGDSLGALKYGETLISRAESGYVRHRVWCLMEMGLTYLDMNALEDAFDYLSRARKLDADANEKARSVQIALALSEAYLRARDYAKAEFMNYTALSEHSARYKENPIEMFTDERSRWQYAQQKLGLAQIAEQMRQHHRALYALEGAEIQTGLYTEAPLRTRAPEAFDPLGEDAFQGSVRELYPLKEYYYGRNYRALGDVDAARQHFAAAIKSSAELNNPFVAMLATYQLGLIALDQRNLEEAVTHLVSAVDAIEDNLERLSIEEFRVALRTSVQDMYDSLLFALTIAQRFSDVWQYSELSRARVYLNMLMQTHHQAAPAKGRIGYGEDYARLSAEMQFVLSRLQRESAVQNTDVVQELSMRLESVRTQKADLVRKLLRAAPSASEDKDAPVAALEEVQVLLEADEALVEYFVAADHLLAIIVRRETISVVVIPVHERTLRARIRAFRALLMKDANRPVIKRDIQVLPKWSPPDHEQIENDLVRMAQELGALVLPLRADIIQGVTKLVIVPHRAIVYLPFAALRDSSGRYLIETMQIRYAYSGSTFALMRAQRQATPAKRVISYVNPTNTLGLEPLPFAASEAEAIRRYWPNIVVQDGMHAHKSQFVKDVEQSDIVHIACHAVFDSQNPLLSALVLANDPLMGDTGLLEVHEIYHLRLHAQLVVLSACETAMSDDSEAGEYSGLIRSFMAAGARQIIGTHWAVDDAASAELMGAFYQQLAEGKTPAEALQNAQLLFIKHDRFASPYFWAGYNLNGA